MSRQLLREPLLHFLLAGALLFLVFAALRPPQEAPDAIVVDRTALLGFIEYRAGTYDPEGFAAVLDSLSEPKLQQLIDEYSTEEMLFREARALDLGNADRVVRQRLIQRMRTLLSDRETPPASTEDLAAYFAAHRDDYTIAPTVTFTHVFFDAGRRGDAAAQADALALLPRLSADAASASPGDAGDWFPYFRNYVERTPAYVAGHFGNDFATRMAALEPNSEWQGPLRSTYGWHLVQLTGRGEERPAMLDEVRDAVEADFSRARADADLARETERLRQRYRVSIGPIRPAVAP